jgi:hypothetical protein
MSAEHDGAGAGAAAKPPTQRLPTYVHAPFLSVWNIRYQMAGTVRNVLLIGEQHKYHIGEAEAHRRAALINSVLTYMGWRDECVDVFFEQSMEPAYRIGKRGMPYDPVVGTPVTCTLPAVSAAVVGAERVHRGGVPMECIVPVTGMRHNPALTRVHFFDTRTDDGGFLIDHCSYLQRVVQPYTRVMIEQNIHDLTGLVGQFINNRDADEATDSRAIKDIFHKINDLSDCDVTSGKILFLADLKARVWKEYDKVPFDNAAIAASVRPAELMDAISGTSLETDLYLFYRLLGQFKDPAPKKERFPACRLYARRAIVYAGEMHTLNMVEMFQQLKRGGARVVEQSIVILHKHGDPEQPFIKLPDVLREFTSSALPSSSSSSSPSSSSDDGADGAADGGGGVRKRSKRS